MNILWEMTLVLYIVAYFLKYSIYQTGSVSIIKQFLLSKQRAMPLLSKCFDAYLFNEPSAARVEMQIRRKEYYKRVKLATATPFVIASVFAKYDGKRHFKNHPTYLKSEKKMLVDMLAGNGRNILGNSLE